MKKILLLMTILSLAACERGGSNIESFGDFDILTTENQNKFLEFFNQQDSLPADNYRLVIGSATNGESGNFSGTISFENGEQIEFSDTISFGSPSSGGTNYFYDFKLSESGGLTIAIDAEFDSCIYLKNEDGNIFIGSGGIIDNFNEADCKYTNLLNIDNNQTDNERYAAAYYAAVDPNNERDTLEKWKTVNRFGEACTTETLNKFGQCEVTAIFRDTKDVGYGRLMYARREDDSSGLTHLAIYVENYQVDAIPGQQYSELNLDAIVNNSTQWHFGTNAIEFSNSNSSTGELYSKFFTYIADDSANNGARLLLADLDERGEKAVPNTCLHCHGGSTNRLLPSDFSLAAQLDKVGDLQGQFKPIEVNSLEFADVDGFRRTDQESNIAFINQAVLDSYKVLQNQNNAENKPSYWDPTDAITLIEGWYGGVDSEGIFINDSYDEDYVLPGWQANGSSIPDGTDEIFKQVILPNCLNCHINQGNYESNNNNFSSYAKFSEYNEMIESFVYKQANMPSGALNYADFWENPNIDKPLLLSQLITGFSSTDSQGYIQNPGEPVAVIVAPYATNVPATLSAAGSVFASSYQWEIISSNAANASFDDSNAFSPVFNASTDDVYELQLTVSNENGETNSVTQLITVDSSKPSPNQITFSYTGSALNVQSVLSSYNCDDCHYGSNSYPASPPHPQIGSYTNSCNYGCHISDLVSFKQYGFQTGSSLYNELLQRINFSDPLKSKLLTKPSNSGNNHGGDLRPGFDINSTNSADKENYDLLLNWILEGAPE